MTEIVPADVIERLVGWRRHNRAHIGRAVSTEEVVYILHSAACRDSGIDLRDCRFSLALDEGIDLNRWAGYEDRPVVLGVWESKLVPLRAPLPGEAVS